MTISRRTLIIDGSRFENDAEHSWHMAVAALLLQEYAPFPKLDVSRAVQMALLHDIVEVHAGDTYAYDAAGNAGREARERQAADIVFSKLPEDQARLFRGLWEEFELAANARGQVRGGARSCAAADPQPQHGRPNLARESHHGRAGAREDRPRFARARPPCGSTWRELVSDAVSKGWLIG